MLTLKEKKKDTAAMATKVKGYMRLGATPQTAERVKKKKEKKHQHTHNMAQINCYIMMEMNRGSRRLGAAGEQRQQTPSTSTNESMGTIKEESNWLERFP